MERKQVMEKRKRGRPRGKKEVLAPQNPSKNVGPLNKEDWVALEYLDVLPTLVMKFRNKLQDQTIQKCFKGNTYLLMGLYDLSMCALAGLSKCSTSTLSRILEPKFGSTTKFDKTSPVIFLGIARALKVSVHTLLFVDLREKFLQLITEVEKGGSLNTDL